MHILTLFPQLLTFSLVAPLLLRMAVGAYGLMGGWQRYKKPYKWASVLYAITSVLLIIGLYTQAAAIVGLILLIWDYLMDKKIAPVTREQKMLRKLIAIVLISLILTGPGFFAMDLPL